MNFCDSLELASIDLLAYGVFVFCLCIILFIPAGVPLLVVCLLWGPQLSHLYWSGVPLCEELRTARGMKNRVRY